MKDKNNAWESVQLSENRQTSASTILFHSENDVVKPLEHQVHYIQDH